MWWLKNVYVVDPSQNIEGIMDVVIKGDKIAALKENISSDEIAILSENEQVEIVEGKGRYLFPGLVDVHTHLREPGQENKEDILSGSRSAVRGGFTSILAMANTKPVIDNRALVEFVFQQGLRANYAHIYPVGAVTKGMEGKELVEMVDLKEGGAVAFSDDGLGIQSAKMMRLALEYAKLTQLPIISHCEDSSLAHEGHMRLGKASLRLGIGGIPPSAESAMVARDLLLAKETGGKLHLAHISTKESVEMIRKAKAEGIDVTAEVNPHHLIFCDDDVELNTNLKVNPPLGSRSDREALIEGLIDGTIDMLATDHAPHQWEEKMRPFTEAPFGILGLETALPAVWQYLVSPGRLSVKRLIEAWSMAPAQRFNLEGGTIKTGARADLVLFDPEYKEEIKAENLCSKSQNTPFLNKTLKGFPVMTWVSGRLVHKNRVVF